MLTSNHVKFYSERGMLTSKTETERNFSVKNKKYPHVQDGIMIMIQEVMLCSQVPPNLLKVPPSAFYKQVKSLFKELKHLL